MADEEEDPYVTAMQQRWEFLAPWWTALKPWIEYTYPETENMEEFVWDAPDIVLKVTVPTRRGLSKDEETFRRDFQKVQEALALITAVEHADYHAYDYILTKHCGVVRGRYGEELDEVKIETRFLLDLDMASHEDQTDDGAITYDLVRFCGTHQREHPSEEYLMALSQIAALDENLKPGEAGVDIRIPVKLQFERYMRGMHIPLPRIPRDFAEMFAGITKAEMEIEMQWAAYSENVQEENLESGTLRCTFVLEPMVADFTELGSRTGFDSMSQRNAKAVENLMLNNVWFSFLEIDLRIERVDADHELEARKSIGLLLRSLLDSMRRTRESAHISYHFDCPSTIQVSQLQAFKLMCDATTPAKDFEAMCSALVLATTTKKLAIDFEITAWNHNNRENWWKWLAYGLFSKRARACSSLNTLDVGRLTAADLRAFTSVLTSEHPEETLCGTTRGLVEERDATLVRGAPIRWDFDEDGQPVLNSRLLTLDTPIELVRTFSDDGTSEWVDVLIAGFGRCQVRRCDLDFHGGTCACRRPEGITSLTIRFQWDSATNLAIVPFLQSIGSSLTTLTLDGPRIGSGRMDENAIIQSCPNLLGLTLVRELIEVQLDFREYRAAKTPIPQLTFSWSDLPKCAGYLSDPQNPLTKCARRLRGSLLRYSVPVDDQESGNAPSFSYYVNAVVKMLEKNERLEYLSVDSPYIRFVSDFKRFHLKPIHRQLKPLQRKCMLAFLSVLESRAPTELTTTKKKNESSEAVVQEIDQHVVVNIFSFAAPPVLREVYFESPQRVVFDDDPQGQRRVQGRHGQFLQDQQAQLAPPALHGEQEQGN